MMRKMDMKIKSDKVWFLMDLKNHDPVYTTIMTLVVLSYSSTYMKYVSRDPQKVKGP